MSEKYILRRSPFVVPTGDGKSIKEHFGLASTGEGEYSIAHMMAPPLWSEPPQKPNFDEVTFVIKGRKKLIIDGGEEVVLNAGESILVKKNVSVQYSNPFDEPVEYLAICILAFSPEKANREE